MTVRNLLDRVETADELDRVGDPLQRGVLALLPRRLRDLLHGVLLGHPLHPAAVQVPVGAWISAAVLDAVPGTGPAAAVLVGVGTATALPATVSGLNDWASLAREQRRVGLVHAAANTVALGLYSASLAARLTGRSRAGRQLGYAGLAVAGLGAYIGGHLSFRQAAAVNQAEPWLRRIPDGWHDVGDHDSLADGRPRVAWIGEVPVLVVRTRGVVTAMIERCGHQTGPLGEGDVVDVDGDACVVCPLHGSTFRLRDGTVVHGPAASSQPLLRTRVEGGRVLAALP